MRPAFLLSLLVLSVALTSPSHADDPTTVLDWDLLDCSYVFATVTVSKLALAPYMPAGFFPLGQGGPNGVVNLAVETDVCASGTGLDGRVEPMSYASVWVPVEPPASLKRPLDGGYFVNFDVLVPDKERRDLLAGYGIRAVDGSIDTRSSPGADAHPVVVELTLDGLGTIVIGVTGPPPVDTARLQLGGRFTQFTEGDADRLVRWDTHWRTTETAQGAGTVTVPVDSWLADVYGAPVMPARVFYGTWSYTDGRIEFPVHV